MMFLFEKDPNFIMKNSELISLKKGAYFKHEEKEYKVIEDGLKYKITCKKKCIVPPTGEIQQAVGVERAIANKWIESKKEEAKTDDAFQLTAIDSDIALDQESPPSNRVDHQPMTKEDYDHKVTKAEKNFKPLKDSRSKNTSTEEPLLSNQTEESKASDSQNYCAPEDASGTSTELPAIEINKAQASSKKKDDQERDTLVSKSSSEKIFFILVDSIRARTFLVRGLIYPAIYDEDGLDRKYLDDHQPESLLLTRNRPQFKNEKQVILKVLLLPGEIKTMEKSEFMLEQPLPISRLYKIEILPEAGGSQRFAKGWITPDVPVPPLDLFCEASEPLDLNDGVIGQQNRDASFKPKKENKDAIRKFDRAMGAVAFWRNADRYVSEVSGHYADYPSGFETIFSTIMDSVDSKSFNDSFLSCFFSYVLGAECPNSQVTASCVLDEIFSTAPYISKDTARKHAKYLFEKLDKNDDLRDAFKKLFEGDYRAAIKLLQKPSIPIEAAVLAALFKYSARRSNDHRVVKAELHRDLPSNEHRHAVLAALGAFHGYAAIDAREENLPSIHPKISGKIETRPDIKFHLRNRFERLLIEALYRHSFGFLDYADVPLDSLYSSFSSPLDGSTTEEESEKNFFTVRSKIYRNELLVKSYQIKTNQNTIGVFYDKTQEGCAYYEFRIQLPKNLFHDLAESKASESFGKTLQLAGEIWNKMISQIFDKQPNDSHK